MTSLYLALGIFVASIVVIGALEGLGRTAAWLLTLLALAGAGMFLYASLLLIRESRVAWQDVGQKTDYLVQHNPLAQGRRCPGGRARAWLGNCTFSA